MATKTVSVKDVFTMLYQFYWYNNITVFCKKLGIKQDVYAEEKYTAFAKLCNALNEVTPDMLAQIVNGENGLTGPVGVKIDVENCDYKITNDDEALTALDRVLKYLEGRHLRLQPTTNTIMNLEQAIFWFKKLTK